MTSTVVRSRVLRDTYRDSVELMRVAAEVERLPGIRRAALLVATPANCELLKSAGLLDLIATTANGASPAISEAPRAIRLRRRLEPSSGERSTNVSASRVAPKTRSVTSLGTSCQPVKETSLSDHTMVPNRSSENSQIPDAARRMS